MKKFIYPQDLVDPAFLASLERKPQTFVSAPSPAPAPAPTPARPRDLITNLVKNAALLLSEATKIADQHGIEFSWDELGYGMGGVYRPKRMTYQEALDLISSGADITPELREKIVLTLRTNADEYGTIDDAEDEENQSGWVSSSSNC